MYGKMQAFGLTEFIPSYAPQLSGANPVSLLTLLLAFPLNLSSYHGGVGSIWWITVLGALIHIWRPEITDGCEISCRLIWQEKFAFYTHTQKPQTPLLWSFPYQISLPVLKFWTNHQSSKQDIIIGGSRDLYRNLLRSLIQHISISIGVTIKVKDTFPSWNQ